MEATTSNTNLSKFHKVSVLDIIKEGKILKPLFSSKVLIDDDDTECHYFVGYFDKGCPLTISAHDNMLEIIAPYLDFFVDDTPLERITDTIKENVNFGTDIHIHFFTNENFPNELIVELYSRELKLFD